MQKIKKYSFCTWVKFKNIFLALLFACYIQILNTFWDIFEKNIKWNFKVGKHWCPFFFFFTEILALNEQKIRETSKNKVRRKKIKYLRKTLRSLLSKNPGICPISTHLKRKKKIETCFIMFEFPKRKCVVYNESCHFFVPLNKYSATLFIK